MAESMLSLIVSNYTEDNTPYKILNPDYFGFCILWSKEKQLNGTQIEYIWIIEDNKEYNFNSGKPMDRKTLAFNNMIIHALEVEREQKEANELPRFKNKYESADNFICRYENFDVWHSNSDEEDMIYCLDNDFVEDDRNLVYEDYYENLLNALKAMNYGLSLMGIE